MPRDACLYFPDIEIQDQSWARSYILFWDEVRTIVPDSIREPYKLADLEVLNGEGLLVAQKLGAFPDEIERASKTMLENWNAIENSVKFSDVGKKLAKYQNNNCLIHKEKVTDELLWKFKDHLEKAVPKAGKELQSLGDVSWEATDPEMAAAYMAILANEISLSSAADPVTNYASLRVPNPRRFTPDRDQGDNFDAQLLEIVMENVVIDPEVDIRKIISFKRTHQSLFNDFREELTKFRSSLEGGSSREVLQNIYVRKIRPKVEAVRGGLTANSIGWGGGGLISFSAVADSAISNTALFGLSDSVGLAATFGLVAAGTMTGAIASARNRRLGEPMSYLASIDRKFALPLWEQ